MSEKTHPTVSRIVRTAVFAAGIAIAVYATDLIVKQYQKYKAEERRRQAQSLLAQTVAALKERLPPPESPDLTDKMPQDFSPYLRRQVLYYPRLNAYKYTFLPRYEYNDRGIPTELRHIGATSGYIPDLLERRSIWFKAENGRWRCFAGVKPSVQIAECSDREVVKGLTMEEHRQIFRQKAADCVRKKIVWPPQENEYIYRISNQTSAENVYLDFAGAPPSVSLILLSEKPTNWYLGNLQHTTIQKIAGWHSESSEKGIWIFGLPNYTADKDTYTPIADIQDLHDDCVRLNRYDINFYPPDYEGKDFGEWFFRQPEKQFNAIVLTDAAPKNALFFATANGRQPENMTLLNTVDRFTHPIRYTGLTDAAINSIEWQCSNGQQIAESKTPSIRCVPYLSGKPLHGETQQDLGGVVLSDNKLRLEDFKWYDLPDWAKRQLETAPQSSLKEDTVTIDGKPYPLSCLEQHGCPK